MKWGNNFDGPVVSSWTPWWKGNQIAIAQEMRFLSVKYRVYSVIVMSIILLGYNPMLSTIQNTQAKRNSLSELDTKINTTIEKEKTYKQQQMLFDEIARNKETLITCINKQSSCDKLPETVSKDLNAVRAYLQIGDLKKAKMDIDEAKILKNINEFIIQKDILSEQRNHNGKVSSISIGDSTVLEDNIIKVPIELTITFDNKQNLLSFLTNIENYIFVDPQYNLDASILFRIEQLQYDIVNYRESQDVAISLSAYAYKWK